MGLGRHDDEQTAPLLGRAGVDADTTCRPPNAGRGEAGTAPPRPGSVSASSNASLLISRTTL